MFQLCMSDKELFHSNFLYALWNNDPTNFEILLKKINPDIPNTSAWIGKREYNNYDFCLIEEAKDSKAKNNNIVKLIIENKVKSIPRKEQLDRYAENIADEKTPLILLSLMEKFPAKNDIDKDGKWKIVSYRDLIAWLGEINWSDDLKKYVNDYCEAMNALVDEVNEYSIEKDTHFFQLKDNEKVYDKYKELRIQDLFDKVWFSQLGQYAADEISKNDFKCDWDKESLAKRIFKETPSNELIYLNSGYTLRGGGGLLDIKILVQEGIILGVQIQGDVYRRIIEYDKEIDLNQYDWLFDLKSNGKYGPEEKKENFKDFENNGQWKYYPDRKESNFLQFGSNFKYQQLEIGRDISIETPVKLIIRDIKLIKSKF